ncbi:UNVERIFIED_CONTAM: hypothetical protein GTU68_040468 [Idotea baltica]|nr:hypothetical protein [Idotea baltica]
MENFRF